MKNSKKRGAFWPKSPGSYRSLERLGLPLALLPHALLLLILIPCIGLAAWLLSELHARERADLQRTADARVALAASSIDMGMLGFVSSLRALPPVSLTTAQDRDIVYARARAAFGKTGIAFCARNEALDLLPSAEACSPVFAKPDDAVRAAAATALSTNAPQITPYRNAADGADAGINLWLAAAADGSGPVLLQAHIPSSVLSKILADFASADTLTMTVADSNGTVLARAGRSSLPGDDANIAERTGYDVEAFANTPQFGWRISATTSLVTLNAASRRNWMSFLLVTSLITAATLAAATFLSRKLLEQNYESTSQFRTFDNDRRMLMHSLAAASHSPDRRRQEPTDAENRLRMALGAGGMGAWQWNRSSGSIRWDSTFIDLLKASTSERPPTAKAVLARVEPHDRRRLLQAMRNALSSSQPLAIDIRVTRFDGEQRWFATRGAPMTDADGQIIGLIGIAYDITDQKQSLSRTDALLREVSHRSKNMLALILAMARLTAREAVDVKSHLKEFTLRVAGLAASQDLIVAADWQSVDLGALAFAEVEAVARSDASRVTISGPSFLVTPEAAQTLGMIVTELTLNAVEHGALSAAGGEVRLTWEFPDDATIMISWHEIGGPRYDPAVPKGYGMAVVERFSTQGLKVNSHIADDADGFTWILTGPIENLGTRPPPHRT